MVYVGDNGNVSQFLVLHLLNPPTIYGKTTRGPIVDGACKRFARQGKTLAQAENPLQIHFRRNIIPLYG